VPLLLGGLKKLLGACAPEQHQPTGLGHLDAQGGDLNVEVHPCVITIQQEVVYFFLAGFCLSGGSPDFFAISWGFPHHHLFCFICKLVFSCLPGFMFQRSFILRHVIITGPFRLIGLGSFSGIAAFALPLPFSLGSPDLFGSGGGGFFGGCCLAGHFSVTGAF
jgi:hypothetical protein